MLAELQRHFAARQSFAFETTLSGRAYLQHIGEWRRAGYHVKLIFLALNTPEDAVRRVAQRVRQGAHDIPEHLIRRRFHAGRKNLEDFYAPAVDAWSVYNNSGDEPVLVRWGDLA